jgi:diguanylate cyclase (GGDEF)-like protein
MSSLIVEGSREGGRLASGLWDSTRQFLSILLSLTALAWLTRMLLRPEPLHHAWAIQAMIAVLAMLAGCWGIIHCYRVWMTPARELQLLLPRVHRGEAPIEQLNEIEGGPRILVPAIQELLRELSSQRAVIAELEIEMRRRAANHTTAIERTIGSLRHQATRDPLTGLFNRRFLDQYLTQSVQRHCKEQKDLCLLMIDVDHFKAVNDTLGHAAGDHLLRSIGGLIRATIRGEDVGFRYGGDEFVVLMPGGTVEAGEALAGRLISQVDNLCQTMKVDKHPRLSIGSSTLTKCPGGTPEGLLEEADRALYDVKKARHARRPGLNDGAEAVQSPPLSRAAG